MYSIYELSVISYSIGGNWKSCGCRGVQYVHWVMHKCIMVKVGGKRNTYKVCKKQVNSFKTGGEIFESRGEIIIFANQGGKCSKTGKTGGKFEICGRQKFSLADENRKFCREKVKFQKFFRKSKKISKIGGKSETGGENASWPQKGWTPLCG